ELVLESRRSLALLSGKGAGERLAVLARELDPARGGEREPGVGRDEVLRHADPLRVEEPELRLRPRQPLIRRPLDPAQGLRIALLDAVARSMAQAQHQLRIGLTRFGG